MTFGGISLGMQKQHSSCTERAARTPSNITNSNYNYLLHILGLPSSKKIFALTAEAAQGAPVKSQVFVSQCQTLKVGVLLEVAVK